MNPSMDILVDSAPVYDASEPANDDFNKLNVIWLYEDQNLETDPLSLTDEKIDARDAEARAADPSRFSPLADVLNALRNRSL